MSRVVIALMLSACVVRLSDPEPVVCTTTAPTACPSPAPGYDRDIAPIIQARCISCHYYDNPDGNWPLETYGHVSDWGNAVRATMLDCSMPPADSGETMSDDERQTLLAWVRCGTPE